MMNPPPKLCFIASNTPAAQNFKQEYLRLFDNSAESEADIIVAIGGDGFMLQTLHNLHHLNKSVYGINCGSVGFLMNSPDPQHLLERLSQAQATVLHPLKMIAYQVDGKCEEAYAINEVSLFRSSPQAAHIQIEIDHIVRIEQLMCDGVLLATPAGSTAYNLSAHGPIIPIGGDLLALTPISPFRPRRWRGALLPNTAQVTFTVLDPDKRPVNATADDRMIPHVVKVKITQAPSRGYTLLFDPDHNLEDRIIKEQFAT
jgi:NAD+ kinase